MSDLEQFRICENMSKNAQSIIGKTKETKKIKGSQAKPYKTPRKTKKNKVFSNHGGQTKCGGAVGEVLKVDENFVFFGFFGFTKGFVRFCPRPFDFFGFFGFPNERERGKSLYISFSLSLYIYI